MSFPDVLTHSISYPGDQMGSHGDLLQPKFKVIEVVEAAEILQAVADRKLRVLALFLVSMDGLVTVIFKQGEDPPVTLLPATSLPLNGQLVLPFSPVGWFETSVGEGLDIALSDELTVSGLLVYVEV